MPPPKCALEVLDLTFSSKLLSRRELARSTVLQSVAKESKFVRVGTSSLGDLGDNQRVTVKSEVMCQGKTAPLPQARAQSRLPE
jgi:hypothetical protein